MNRYFKLIRIPAIFAGSLLAGACEPAEKPAEPESAPGVVSDDVPQDLAEEARALAEGGPVLLGATEAGRVVFVGVETMREKSADEPTQAEPRTPLYRTTHYTYASDTTIYTTVNLQEDRVVGVEEARHVPTPITAEELNEARELALADRALQEAVGPELARYTVEALGLYSEDPKDPIYGHRVMTLLFRTGDRYLANLEVNVDLTRRTVSVTKKEMPQ